MCDCTAEPPGELMTSATALAPRCLNALSNVRARPNSVSPGRSGVAKPMTPASRTTGTTAMPRRQRRGVTARNHCRTRAPNVWSEVSVGEFMLWVIRSYRITLKLPCFYQFVVCSDGTLFAKRTLIGTLRCVGTTDDVDEAFHLDRFDDRHCGICARASGADLPIGVDLIHAPRAAHCAAFGRAPRERAYKRSIIPHPAGEARRRRAG